MSAINYTYYATIGAGVEIQVYPSGDWSLDIHKAEEDFPFCKDSRIKCDGEFIFSGNDYTLIKTADCCDKIDLRIQCNGVDYWFGYFAYPYDLHFDEDRCEVSGTPKPLDKYYYFDLYADTEEQSFTSKNLTWQSDFPTAPGAATWEAIATNCVPCEPIMDLIETRFLNPPLIPGGFSMNLKSTFFKNDKFPNGDDPYPPGPDAENYVTNCPNKSNHIVMVMALDICNVAAGAPWVTWPKTSFNEFMEILHNTFNTWWYIDERGDFRIEHIYFWDLYFPVSYNLTTIDGGRWIVNTSKYDYRTEEMPKIEQWNWSTHYNTFKPETLTYYNCFLPGISRFIKEYSLDDLTTDIEYIASGTNYLLPSITCANLKNTDFMFLRCLLDGDQLGLGYPALPACADYVVWFSRYLDDGNNHLNAHLSPINLIANYWMHDRPLWTGFMVVHNQIVDFESTWKTLRQMEFSFPVCCGEKTWPILTGEPGNNPEFLYQFGIDFNRKIITQYLAGELYTGTIKDGMLTLQLIYEDIACEEDATDWSEICEL